MSGAIGRTKRQLDGCAAGAGWLGEHGISWRSTDHNNPGGAKAAFDRVRHNLGGCRVDSPATRPFKNHEHRRFQTGS